MLKTKLLIPNLADTIARPRFNDLFKAIKNKKIVTVTAGAGYGKTTLVAQACTHLGLDTVWYRLNYSDGDFATFIAYVLTGIRKHYAGFGPKTFQRTESAQPLKSEQESILTLLLNEIEETVSRDLVIVLDDFHLVANALQITDALTFIVDRLPPQIHIVIISRGKPPIKLSRLVATRETFGLDEKDLAFDTNETEQLFKDVFDTLLEPKALKVLQARTEGWVSGLILFNYTLKRKNHQDLENQLLALQGTAKTISDYLEENVYAALAPATRNFLIKTSILAWLKVDLCDQLLNIGNSRQILTDLAEKHLFVFAFDETHETFHYHHLFQEFLQKKLQTELGRIKTAALHRQAAGIWENCAQVEEALQHYLLAGDFDQASILLGTLGRHLIKNGRTDTYLNCFKQIPEAHIEKSPWLQYTHGRALELCGRTLDALATHQKAHAAFSDQSISKGASLALNRMASNYYVIGDFKKAEAKFEALLINVENDPRRLVDALGHLIFISSHLGKFDQADQHFFRTKDLLSQTGESVLHAWVYINYGFRYCAAGDMVQALKFGEMGNRICKRLKLYHLLTFGYHLIAFSNYYRGDFSKCLKTALKGIRLGTEKGFREIAHSWLLIDACFGSAAAGKFADAIDYGQKAISICRQIESRWSEAWAYHALQQVYLNSGDLELAGKAARSSLNIIGRLSLPYDKGLMQGGLAAVLIHKNRLEEAEPLLVKAEKILAPSTLFATRIYLWRARCFWEKKAPLPALEKLHQALQLSKKYEYDHWVVTEKEWIIPLLVKSFAAGKEKSNLLKLFPQFGLDGIHKLKNEQKNKKAGIRKATHTILNALSDLAPAGLRIYCFGRFKVFRGDFEISPQEWTNQKASMLLKYLCFYRNKGYIVKDQLMELLWPEADAEKSRKRLNVALTTLRKILEPELPRGKTSAYLLKRGDAYHLQLGSGGYCDVDDFDSKIEMAEAEKNPKKEINHALKADALFRGDLFAENPYEKWCIDARANYHEKYLRNLKRLISHYENRQNLKQSIQYAGRYLAADPYAEDIYQTLMRLYHKSGNKHMLIKTFEVYKDRLENDLGCPLAEEVVARYREMVSE
jgi:LuxR family transcriptional regulator, maltose regulon positive regulatory protein